MFALIVFLDGTDSGKRSIVPIDWIRNGEAIEDEFLAEGELSGPILVEWREAGRKRNKEAPWPVYTAKVLSVACNEKTLEKTLAEMERQQQGAAGQGSKRASKPNQKYMEEEGAIDHTKKKQSSCPSGVEVAGPSKKKNQKRSADPKIQELGELSKKKAIERQAAADARLWEEKKMAQLQRTLQDLRKENFDLKAKVSELQEIITSHIPQIKDDIAFLAGRDRVKELPAGSSDGDTSAQSLQIKSVPASTPYPGRVVCAESSRPTGPELPEIEAPPKVEILKGSGVVCNRATWMAASSSKTCTQMVRQLLIGVFSIEELLESNLSGGMPKRGGGEHLKALDVEKKNAIIVIPNRQHQKSQ